MPFSEFMDLLLLGSGIYVGVELMIFGNVYVQLL